MEKGKCEQAILGSFSKVTSPGSDKDTIRTCFLGHIIWCGGNVTITVLLSQVLCVFIKYTRSGEIGQAWPSLVCRRKAGYLLRAAASAVQLSHHRCSTSSLMLVGHFGGAGWVSTDLTELTSAFRAGCSNPEMSCPSRSPPIPGHGAWAALSCAGTCHPSPRTHCGEMLGWSRCVWGKDAVFWHIQVMLCWSCRE